MSQNTSQQMQSIRNLQIMLHSLSSSEQCYSGVVPDGIFGKQTARAVSAFQKNHNLAATGIVDQTTWDTIVNEYEIARIEREHALPIEINIPVGTKYTRGTCCIQVTFAQVILKALSDAFHCISPIQADGTINDDTAAAVSDFQKLCKLNITGEIDKQTWKYLALMFSASQECNIINP